MQQSNRGTDPGGRRDLAVVVVVAALALLLLGPTVGGVVEVPLRPDQLPAWAGDADPALLAVVLLRSLGLLLAAHALLVGLLALVADLLRARPLAQLARLLAVGPLRAAVLRGTSAVVGTGLLLAPVTASAAAATDSPPAAAVMSPGDDSPVATARPLPPVDVTPGHAAVERAVPLDATAPDTATLTEPASDSDPATGEAGRDPGRWRTISVRPGDHLWGLASRDVAAHTGTNPEDAAVHRHWVAVVEANRDRLVVPGNPDLVLPDQQLVLPPVEER